MAHSVLLVYEADWDRCKASEKEHDRGLTSISGLIQDCNSCCYI